MNKDKYGPTNEHSRIRAMLLQLYGFRDMLTGEEIPDFRSASYHHIDKNEFGGQYTVENGAMLLKKTHAYIHNVLEAKDPDTFDLLTECLMLYKICLDQNNEELINQFQQEVQPEVKARVLTYKYKPKR